MSDYPKTIATPAGVRSTSRRIIGTPDGLFVIRRLVGLDFLESSTPLIMEAAAKLKGATAAIRQKEAERLAKKYEGDTARLTGVILTRGVVPTTVWKRGEEYFLDGEAGDEEKKTFGLCLEDEDTEDRISAYNLNQETVIILIQGVKELSGMKPAGGLEDRLRSFRDDGHVSGREIGDEVPSTPE